MPPLLQCQCLSLLREGNLFATSALVERRIGGNLENTREIIGIRVEMMGILIERKNERAVLKSREKSL